jgi:predicted GH43/DUF377 family glycosyl hydrolase
MTVQDTAGELARSTGDQSGTVPYQLERQSILMRPDPDNPHEAGGVLNPGGVRTPSGDYLLFPRLVALGNYSRVGVARVIYDNAGIPQNVERLGIALEPEAPYERNDWTGGGCEDARVNYVEPLGTYVMTYAAFGPDGPRSAMAISHDLMSWTRLGLIEFASMAGADMNRYTNKDHVLFPEAVPGPDGRLSLALIHRPMYEYWAGELATHSRPLPMPATVADRRWTMWISYCPLEDADWANPRPGASARPPVFSQHQVLAQPRATWEAERLGAGTPPIRLATGWLMFYHGIEALPSHGLLPNYRYSAGALLLDARDPRTVLYRSANPVLEPSTQEELFGVVGNVVFPTAVDQHESYLDVYYGIADDCIGAARMTIR